MTNRRTKIAGLAGIWLSLFIFSFSTFAKLDESLVADPVFHSWTDAYNRAEAKVNLLLPADADHYDRLFAILAHAPAFLKPAISRSHGQEAAYRKLVVRTLDEAEAPKRVLHHMFMGPNPAAIMWSMVGDSGLVFEEDSHAFKRAAEAYISYALPKEFDQVLAVAKRFRQVSDVRSESGQAVAKVLKAYLSSYSATACRTAACAEQRRQARIELGHYGSIPHTLMNCLRALTGRHSG